MSNKGNDERSFGVLVLRQIRPDSRPDYSAVVDWIKLRWRDGGRGRALLVVTPGLNIQTVPVSH